MVVEAWFSVLKASVAVSLGALVLTVLLSNQSFAQSGAFNPNPKTAAEAIDQLVWANRILANEGIFDYLGHVTIRNPENSKTFFIARDIAPESVTKNDILEVDQEGNVLTKTQFTPYQERTIHAAIFKAREDVKSVIHAHPIPVVALSVSRLPFRILSHPAAQFYEGVPLYDEYDFTSANPSGMLVRTKEEGDRVAKKLGKSKAMLMWAHGYNVVGRSLNDSIGAAIAFRDNAIIQLAAEQHGPVRNLSYDQAKVGMGSGPTPRREMDRGWNAWG
jgi:ribulose-5-phosphate 4-epimerase/fuculose-1-phosphate aldolase